MPIRRDLHQHNRASWNAATPVHNARKRDQAGYLAAGGELLFDEDYALLGPLAGRRVLHLQCNSGQDSLCLARRGAEVTGVDLSDEAIAFAEALAREAGIPAQFERADLYDWLAEAAAAGRRFDVVYSSYGWLGWLSDLAAWAAGVAGVLAPGGRLVLVEFHPVVWLFDRQRQLAYPYFGAREGHSIANPEGVGDYVTDSGGALAPSGLVPSPDGAAFHNPHPAHEFAWSIADLLGALRGAGLELERFDEWDHSNGCRFWPDMVPVADADGRRWTLPPDQPRLPLMLGLSARKPAGLRMFQVDAFADAPFSGNPAAVCVLEQPLEAAQMQAVAAENNLSETAFIRRVGEQFAIRWFTPTTEVDLCGHATLASAFVVLTALEPAREQVAFASRSGVLRVRREDGSPDPRLIMALPADPPARVEPPAGLAAALGVTPLEVHRASYWLVVLGSEAEVRAVRPDFAALAGIPPGEVIVTAPADSCVGPGDAPGPTPSELRSSGDPALVATPAEPPLRADFVSRFFAPGVGIDEDPVTGSAHCILAPYWAARLGKPRLRARQISARGGELECELVGDIVELTGRCVLYLDGRISV